MKVKAPTHDEAELDEKKEHDEKSDKPLDGSDAAPKDEEGGDTA